MSYGDCLGRVAIPSVCGQYWTGARLRCGCHEGNSLLSWFIPCRGFMDRAAGLLFMVKSFSYLQRNELYSK